MSCSSNYDGFDRLAPQWFGGTVWTADFDRGLEIARSVDTRSFGINGYTLDFGAPFGGTKASGIGRELGPEGLAAYFQTKSIFTTA
ncbi:Geranial dehydrogenase [Rhodococcus erythropolis]|nr:Geranial dehydrogenase [Rhodococcus erythropolis]